MNKCITNKRPMGHIADMNNADALTDKSYHTRHQQIKDNNIFK